MLKFKFNGKDLQEIIELDSPNVEVSYSLTPEVLKEIGEKMEPEHEAFLFMVVVSKNNNGDFEEDSRYLTPLKRGFELVQFQRPGLNTIYATIVWRDPGEYGKEKWRFRHYYLEKDGRRFKNSLTEFFTGKFQLRMPNIGLCQINIKVPDTFFAKPPAEWERKLINFFYDNFPADNCFNECQLRALRLKTVPVALWYCFRVSIRLVYACFGLLLLLLRPNFKAVFDVHSWDIRDIFDGAKPLWSRTWRNEKGEEKNSWYLFFLSPAYLIFAAAIDNWRYLLGHGDPSGWLHYVVYFFLMTVIVLVSAAVIITIGARQEAKEEEVHTPEETAKIYESLLSEDIKCVNLSTKLAYGFKKIKKNVCQPYAKR